MNRRIAYLFAALVLVLMATARVSAHANLVRSEPEAGAVLQAAPRELVLHFSEDLDPSFSRVQLFNSRHQLVNAGPGRIDPGAPLVLRLELGALPDDSYTAIWRVRSAVDGHVTEGSIPFGVGVAVDAPSLLPPVGTPDPATAPPPPLPAALRWLLLLASAVAFGGLSFALLVWRPAYRHAGQEAGHLGLADAAMGRAIARLVVIGGLVFLGLNVLFLVVQAAEAADAPLAAALGDPVVQLLRGRSGQLWLVRVLLALVLVAGARWLPPAGGGAAWPWWVALSLGAGVLLTFSLTAHAATLAEGAALAVAMDWLHLLAMVAWLGGLLPLAFAIRAARRDPATVLPLGTLIPRFSRVAVLSVVALVLTGLYSYLLHIDRLPLLVSTTYGRALLVKLALFGGLLIFGALNLLVFSPRLRAGRGRSVLVFGRTVRVELLLGTLVLLATGVMISIPPSKTAWETRQQVGVLQEARVGQVTLTLRIAPGQVGDNEFAVDVTDRRPGGASTPGQVLLRFHMADMEMGTFQVETKPSNGQRYAARGSYLTMAGTWQVEALLQRPGFDDVRHTFTITPGQTTESAGLSVSRILANTLSPLAGIGVMGIVFAALAFLRRAGLRHPRARQRAAVVGVAFFLVGSVASAGALASAYRAAQPNPVPATEESLARGREIYGQHCASCHGISGRGDGLAGRLLRPRPADFRVHLAAGHSDAQLYDWVAHGVPGTGMPAWEGQLTEQQIWDVINYIRTFASP